MPNVDVAEFRSGSQVMRRIAAQAVGGTITVPIPSMFVIPAATGC